MISSSPVIYTRGGVDTVAIVEHLITRPVLLTLCILEPERKYVSQGGHYRLIWSKMILSFYRPCVIKKNVPSFFANTYYSQRG